MKDSMKNLLGLFPSFLDKKDTSNFFKSQSVTNQRFQDVYQSLFDIVESFRLDKRILIWKEQTKRYAYTIQFRANFPNLKTVTLYKNDEVIYTKSFKYEDNVSTFKYSYKGNTVNDGYTGVIIPTDTFRVYLETWDEIIVEKGFPENDDLLGNIFDHDVSLDEIGALNNIPRKEYILVDSKLYSSTEPPYNNRLTEDDYHYMQRMLEYNLRLHDTPAPILEIWKLYGIDATMENREKLLLKVFDLEKHPNFIDNRVDENGEYIKEGDRWFSGTLNENTGEIIPWTPEPWEHQDKFCDYDDNLGKYFFVKTSTTIPVKKQNVIFYFKFLNSLGRELTEVHTVDITLDGNTVVSGFTGDQYTLTSDHIPQDKDNYYIITGKDSKGEVIGEETVTIIVRGCNSGDFYVSPTGNDNNNGKSRSKPFKTIQKAVNAVNGDKNLIILLNGDYEITKPVSLNQSCTILGCGSVHIENLQENLFFNVPSNDTLILQDLTLVYKGDVCLVEDTTFINRNGDGSNADVILYFTNAPVLVITKLELDFVNKTYNVGDTVNFTGTLKDRLNNALTSKTIKVTNNTDNTKITPNPSTDSNGAYSGSLIAKRPGDLTLTANYAGNSTYRASFATATITIKVRLQSILAGYDYVVMDLLYDESTQNWRYITKPVSEINTLEDLSGAVRNLKYNNKMDVTFNRFISQSTSDSLTRTNLTSLRGLLMGIEYDEYNIKYERIKIFGETKLSLNVSGTTIIYSDGISFSGKLTDQYDNPLPNQTITVNGDTYTTNNNGEYSGSITFDDNIPKKVTVNATYSGDRDYEASSKSKSVTVLSPLSELITGPDGDYDYVVMNLVYDETTMDWDYSLKPTSEIESLSDLDGAVMNLNINNGDVEFERFNYTSEAENINKQEYQSLDGLLMAIEYDDYKVEYTKFEVN